MQCILGLFFLSISNLCLWMLKWGEIYSIYIFCLLLTKALLCYAIIRSDRLYSNGFRKIAVNGEWSYHSPMGKYGFAGLCEMRPQKWESREIERERDTSVVSWLSRSEDGSTIPSYSPTGASARPARSAAPAMREREKRDRERDLAFSSRTSWGEDMRGHEGGQT